MQKTPQIIDDIRAHNAGTALWWLGNAGWAIKSNDLLLLIDPVITLSAAEDPTRSEIGLPLLHELPLQARELGPRDPDLCLVTHGHGDHLASRTVAILAANTRCRFIVPRSCRARMLELGVPVERMIEAVHGRRILYEHMAIEPTKALHGHLHGSVYREASLLDCGYVIRDDRWSIFHPGDSVLLHEHLEMSPPDVFLASITEHNMWVHNTALLANLWQPRYVVPMHYDTYAEDIFWTVGDPQHVLPHLHEAVRQHFLILPQGQKLLLPGTVS